LGQKTGKLTAAAEHCSAWLLENEWCFSGFGARHLRSANAFQQLHSTHFVFLPYAPFVQFVFLAFICIDGI